MKHFKPTIAALAIAFAIPTTANAQLFGGGSFGNPFNAGPIGSTLTGAGAGAGIGALLAPSGRGGRGAAIGAALGGASALALNSLNQSRSQQFGGQQFGGQQFGGQQFGGQQFIGQSYGAPVGYGAQPVVYGGQTQYSGQNSVSYVQGPTQVTTTRYVQYPVQAQRAPQYVPNVTVAAPNVRLAGPPLQETFVHRGLTRVEHLPVARAEHYVEPARIVYQSPRVATPTYTQQTVQQPVYQQAVQHTAPATLCYAGSDKRYDSWGNEIRTASSCNR